MQLVNCCTRDGIGSSLIEKELELCSFRSVHATHSLAFSGWKEKQQCIINIEKRLNFNSSPSFKCYQKLSWNVVEFNNTDDFNLHCWLFLTKPQYKKNVKEVTNRAIQILEYIELEVEKSVFF